jgi:hypothetical protein
MIQERHHDVVGERAAYHHLDRDMDNQEPHGTERDGAVHRLRDDPAPWEHDDAIGCKKAHTHRRGEPDKRENARVKEQETQHSHFDGIAGPGYSRDRQGSGQSEPGATGEKGPVPLLPHPDRTANVVAAVPAGP